MKRGFLVDSVLKKVECRDIHILPTLIEATNRQFILSFKILMFKYKQDLITNFSKLVITERFKKFFI
jgi:hypothetical protein